MAILEIALLPLNNDPLILKNIRETVFAAIDRVSSEGAPVNNGLRGFVVSEDGRDVSGEARFAIVNEWNDKETFQSFAAAPPPSFAEFITTLKEKDNMTGPGVLNLFEAGDDEVARLLSSADGFHLTTMAFEYISIKPTEGVDASALKEIIRAGLNALFGEVTTRVTVGAVEEDGKTMEIAAVAMHENDTDLATAQALPGRQELLKDIAGKADVKTFVVKFDHRLK